MATEQRRFFRVVYPVADRPQLVLEDQETFPVLDASERGLRFGCVAPRRWAAGETYHGHVHFQDGSRTSVVGRVIRRGSDHVALELTVGIPLATIMREQRSLLARYRELILPRQEK